MIAILVFIVLAIAPAMSYDSSSYISFSSYADSSDSIYSFITDEEIYISAEITMPSVVSALMSYYDPTSISDLDDSSEVQYLAYLEAKYPKLAKAIREIASAEKYYPELAEYESEFLKAAQQDPHILSQFSAFMKNAEQLAKKYKEDHP